MKKLVISKKVITVIAIILMLLATTVHAANNYSFKFNLTPDKTVVEEGDTITIAMKLSKINVGSEGINNFSFKFIYDENFFGDVTMTSKNNWSITYNNEKDNEEYGKALAVILKSGVTTDQEVGEIKLKVKKNLTKKSGELKFAEVSTNNGADIINEQNQTIEIKIKENINDGKEDDDKNNNQTGNNQQGNGQGNGQTNTPGSNNQDENISKGPLPQTNVEEWKWIVILAIVAVLIIGCISYIAYRKQK